MLLDTTHNIATPEGVELRLPVAGLGARSLAWLIDAFIKFFLLIVLSIVLNLAGGAGMGLQLLAAFIVLWFYNVLFEVYYHGATPGKRALGLRVMNENGTPVGWSGSLIRNLIRAVDTLPGTYLFGCISVLMTRQFQRLGDLAAGTIVVHQGRQAAISASSQVDPVPVKVPLSLAEQQAIVSFGERAPRISAQRSEELASLVTPIFGEIDAASLRGQASWLVGSTRHP